MFGTRGGLWKIAQVYARTTFYEIKVPGFAALLDWSAPSGSKATNVDCVIPKRTCFGGDLVIES